MGIFTFVLVVLWLLKSILISSGARRALSAGQQFSLDFFTLLLAIPAVYYAWKIFSLMKRKLLWKIRRRLILAHIFIGAIPVLMMAVIVYFSALLFFYQLSYYLISNQIGTHIAHAHALNLTLRAGMEQAVANSQMNRAGLQSILNREAKYVLAAYPSASIVLQVQNLAGGQSSVFVANSKGRERLLQHYRAPRWVGDREFSGLVVEDSQPAVQQTSKTAEGADQHGKLYLRSLAFSNFRPENPFSIEVSVPFDHYLLDRLKSALGQDLLLAHHLPNSGLNVMLQNTEILKKNVLSATFDIEEEGSVGRPVGSVVLFPISWKTGSENSSEDIEVLFVELSSSKLIQNVFRSESSVGKTILGVLRIVIGFFLAVEIISIIIGIVLTKSITSAVFNLDRGTEFIKRGEFSHRVVVKSDDQLGALAKSFNQMTEYVQALVKERVQRERLERELEIAKEVQEQLFPRHAPRMNRMELTGLCLPARVVSGDYYDFLQFNDHSMGMALGDICGKGISAALLMANLQATLRSNVINLLRGQNDSFEQVHGEGAVARVVKLLNDQIYSYTAANKFVSFFYAVYDDDQSVLTYCNAGHNPPLYFGNGGCQRLSTGGTVVGIFPDAQYQQATLHLHPHDLLVAYTDGIVESVNEYGEEFGEQRLVGAVQKSYDLPAEEIQKVIFDEVLRWAYEEERDDDMTLIVAKIL